MKKTVYIGMIGLFAMYGFTTLQQTPEVDKKALTASCKKKIEPYKYDSQKFTKINFTKKAQQLEVEVPVFIGEKYRLVFNTSSLPKPIKISVYTKDKESSKREPIFTSNPGENEMVFDVPRVRKMYVDYDVPLDSTGSNASGFVVFMMGYK
ncbi:MAG: hypothetical protein ACT4ON_11460 [Bacteroidota bacterium]